MEKSNTRERFLIFSVNLWKGCADYILGLCRRRMLQWKQTTQKDSDDWGLRGIQRDCSQAYLLIIGCLVCIFSASIRMLLSCLPYIVMPSWPQKVYSMSLRVDQYDCLLYYFLITVRVNKKRKNSKLSVMDLCNSLNCLLVCMPMQGAGAIGAHKWCNISDRMTPLRLRQCSFSQIP